MKFFPQGQKHATKLFKGHRKYSMILIWRKDTHFRAWFWILKTCSHQLYISLESGRFGIKACYENSAYFKVPEMLDLLITRRRNLFEDSTWWQEVESLSWWWFRGWNFEGYLFVLMMYWTRTQGFCIVVSHINSAAAPCQVVWSTQTRGW